MNTTLIEFSVENYKIFKNKITFSTVGRKGEHTFKCNGENLFKTSLIYGPNASGKSSLLEAFYVMRGGIINSANNKEGDKLPYHCYLLSENNKRPIFWELVFSINKKIFNYNFSILKNEIISENLSEILSNGEKKIHLSRNEQTIKLFNGFKGSEDIADVKTKKEVLFLSAAFQWNNKLANDIVKGIRNINVISGPNSSEYRGFTMKLFKNNSKAKIKILNLLNTADFCINDGHVEKIKIPESIKKQIASLDTKGIPETIETINFSHKKFNSKNEVIGNVLINMDEESMGTQRFFDILGPVCDTLENGRILFIDEFDNSLHPLLTKFIIDLFEKRNPNNAQLIVTTHDTSLLSHKRNFNKAQIWFTEKDQYGAANLFSLAEFDDNLRNDTEYSKKYLEGRFGAVPFIKSL